MNLEQKKKLYKILLCVLVIGAVAFSLRCMFSEPDRDGFDTDTAVERIESSAIRATDRIESAASRTRDARDAIERADRELTRSEDSVGEIQDVLTRCRDRVGRCQTLNERAIGILDSIEGGSGK